MCRGGLARRVLPCLCLLSTLYCSTPSPAPFADAAPIPRMNSLNSISLNLPRRHAILYGMKTPWLRKAIYLVDIVLIVVLFLVVAPLFSAQSASGLPEPVDDSLNTAGSPGPPDAITDAEAVAISTSGVIVPKPSSGAPSSPQPAAQTVKDASASFEYILVGTAIVSSGPAGPYAFFEGPGGVQSVKGTNDIIGGATIVMILDDSVLLEQSGQRFRITLQKPRGSVASAAVFGSKPPSRPSASPQPEEPAAEDASDEEAAVDDEWEDPDQMVVSEDDYREYLQNFGRYANEITTQTHYDEDGNVAGILLARVPTSSLAYQRGLREGDIVMSVQDTDITDVGVALRAAWKVLEDEDYLVDVIIMRNGEEEVLTYEIWPE